MLPIVVSMAMNANINPSRFLMPLAFASSMGGMATLIGTPPNLVVQEALSNAGYNDLSFFSFTPIGIVCITVGIIILIPLSKWFLTRKDENKKTDAILRPLSPGTGQPNTAFPTIYTGYGCIKTHWYVTGNSRSSTSPACII